MNKKVFGKFWDGVSAAAALFCQVESTLRWHLHSYFVSVTFIKSDIAPFDVQPELEGWCRFPDSRAPKIQKKHLIKSSE